MALSRSGSRGFRDQALAGSGGGAAVGSGLLLLRNLQANRPGPEAGMLKRCLARCGNRVAAALNPAPVWPVNDPGYAVVPDLSTRILAPALLLNHARRKTAEQRGR